MDVITLRKLTVAGSRAKGTAGQITRANGELSSHVIFTAYNNERIKVKGEWIDKNTPLSMSAWSSKDHPDAGQAEFIAKHLAIGTTFSCLAELRTYEVPVTNKEGQTFSNADGTPVMKTMYQFQIVPRSIEIIAYSAEQIASEIKTYYARLDAGQHAEGQMDFLSRPPRWNSTDPRDEIGIKHALAWKNILEFRAKAVYTGGEVFGFFKVKNPTASTVPSIVSVAGFSYDQWKTKWTDAMMIAELAKGKNADYDFSVFVQAGLLKADVPSPTSSVPDVPAVPKTPSVPETAEMPI